MKKSSRFISSVILSAMLLTNVSMVQAAYDYTPQYNQGFNSSPLQGRVVVVPAGTTLQTVAASNISSATLTVGDGVSVSLAEPFVYQGVVVAPAGSVINGDVVVSQKAGRAGKNGSLKIKFSSITTPAGQTIPISAKIATDDNTGILVGGTSKDRAKDIAKDAVIGTAAGALLGTAIGAIAGGGSGAGRGAWSGTAIGGGLGLGKAMIDKGIDVVIPPGSPLNIIFDQPTSVNPLFK